MLVLRDAIALPGTSAAASTPGETTAVGEATAVGETTARADIATLEELSKEKEEEIQALTMELNIRTASVEDLETRLKTTEDALSAVASSLGAGSDCVRVWKNEVSEAAPGTGDDEPLAELLSQLHAAAACKFPSPLGLEPTTGAITVAIPRQVVGQMEGTNEGGEGGLRPVTWKFDGRGRAAARNMKGWAGLPGLAQPWASP
eukprot:jgi/Undpi1/13110/HiC_scaffold_8.g02772.m1